MIHTKNYFTNSVDYAKNKVVRHLVPPTEADALSASSTSHIAIYVDDSATPPTIVLEIVLTSLPAEQDAMFTQ